MKQIALFMVSLFFVVGMALVGEAQVNISINVPPPPPLQFAAPPDVVVVPSGGSDVYLVPNTVGVYFHGGYWYRFHRDHWFRASVYNGSWVAIGAPLVPQAVVAIPPDYILGVPPGYHRIHYGDFHNHWRDWGHNHYWNNQAWYRDHSQHHWGGREFHKPPPAHHGGDVQRKADVHHAKTDAHGKTDVHSKTNVHKTAEVHGKTNTQHQQGEGQHHQGK